MNDGGGGTGDLGLWKKKHPERYTNPINPHVCPQIKEAMKPITDKGDKVHMVNLAILADVTLGPIVMIDGFEGKDEGEDILCASYMAGKCPF